jgi:hypothetical protein
MYNFLVGGYVWPELKAVFMFAKLDAVGDCECGSKPQQIPCLVTMGDSGEKVSICLRCFFIETYNVGLDYGYNYRAEIESESPEKTYSLQTVRRAFIAGKFAGEAKANPEKRDDSTIAGNDEKAGTDEKNV